MYHRHCFSVLLSIYYKEQPTFLCQCLDSIFSQTLQSTEVVLVKDGPLTEELDAVISLYRDKYAALKVVELSQNIGLGKALNVGLRHCSYDFVARMDTDDIAKPDRFARQLAVFGKHPEVDVCSAWIDEFVGDASNVTSVRKLPESHEGIRSYAEGRNPVNHPVVMFRRSAVLAAGGYQHFPLLEDYYLWVRMLMNGAKFYNIQESLLYFRSSADMFRRRGGWNYAMNEIRFQKMLYRVGFIGVRRLVMNVTIRFVSRVMPNTWRAWLYKNVLRKRY